MDTQHAHPGMMGSQHDRHIIPFPSTSSRLSPAGLGPDRLASWTSRIGGPRDLIYREDHEILHDGSIPVRSSRPQGLLKLPGLSGGVARPSSCKVGRVTYRAKMA